MSSLTRKPNSIWTRRIRSRVYWNGRRRTGPENERFSSACLLSDPTSPCRVIMCIFCVCVLVCVYRCDSIWVCAWLCARLSTPSLRFESSTEYANSLLRGKATSLHGCTEEKEGGESLKRMKKFASLSISISIAPFHYGSSARMSFLLRCTNQRSTVETRSNKG